MAGFGSAGKARHLWRALRTSQAAPNKQREGKMTGRIAKTLFACTCLAGAIPAIPASAQPAAQPSASGTGLEEIVVTARRREEKLQTVPVAVTAFSPKELEQKAIQSSSDLQHYVPSMMSSQQSRDEQV